ncbi:flavodoxin domain-containing protein [Kiloniella sp. b19]|uniref:flavodoxin domain-containing protein n=1 Tax=Kiloniella sp. GXU_MW_B19 TaxID=3141326 RepID=UPI0031D2F1B7
MRLEFLYGTETGTAEFVCRDLQEALPDIPSTIISLEDKSLDAFDTDTLHVIICSTFGAGELPETAKPFYDRLTSTQPDLSHVRFAMFGLGDTDFDDTFGVGSELLMKALLASKATMIGERDVFDASGTDMPEDVAIPWLKNILGRMQ